MSLHDPSFLLYCILIMIEGEGWGLFTRFTSVIKFIAMLMLIIEVITIIPIPTISVTSLLVRYGSKYSRVQ